MSTIPPEAVESLQNSPDEAAQRLNSWKEIAAWFGRDVRTAQLWEKKECLPVHRHEHSTRASVYAHPAELDEWLRNRRQESTQPSDDLNGPEAVVEAEVPVRGRSLGAVYLSGAILLCVMAVGTSFLYVHEKDAGSSRSNVPITMAVLPFEDLSSGDSEDFLVDGLTEDLITDLGRAGPLQVISRRSVMQFKNRRESLSEIARQLHATVILEGKVARQNGQVRITVQLLDASHDRIIWAQDYRRNLQDVLSLQDEVATEIALAATRTLTANSNPDGK